LSGLLRGWGCEWIPHPFGFLELVLLRIFWGIVTTSLKILMLL